MAEKAVIKIETDKGYVLFNKKGEDIPFFLTVSIPEGTEDYGDFIRNQVSLYTGGTVANIKFEKSYTNVGDPDMVKHLLFDACCFTGVKRVRIPYTSHTIVSPEFMPRFIGEHNLIKYNINTKKKGLKKSKYTRPTQPKTTTAGKTKVKTKSSILNTIRKGY